MSFKALLASGVGLLGIAVPTGWWTPPKASRDRPSGRLNGAAGRLRPLEQPGQPGERKTPPWVVLP
jgi:hypothetical protein